MQAVLHEEKLQGVWNDFIGGITNRTPRHFILSKEKYRFINSILSWSSVEYSAMSLCQPYFERKPPMHVYFYVRFLCVASEGIEQIRQDAIQIALTSERNVTVMFHKNKIIFYESKNYHENYKIMIIL